MLTNENWLPDSIISKAGDYFPRQSWFRVPVRVLGCLIDGTITAYTIIGHVRSPRIIPVELIPFDLRMPNSEFDLIELMIIRNEKHQELEKKSKGTGIIRVIRVEENYDPKIDGLA